MARKRVYVAYTGGTIGMKKTGSGYRPARGYLGELLSRMPEFQGDALPQLVIHEYDPLIDSSDTTPAHWEIIAQDIATHPEFDGYVVLHGTDTMAYTASALSFMLEGLTRPVIFTGSQIPLCEIRSDARENLIDAFTIAGHETEVVPEVSLLFNGVLFRGNRSIKVDADSLDAFNSPNCRPLGKGGVHLTLFTNRIRKPATGGLRVRPLGTAHVASLRLFPGMQPRLLEDVLRPPLQGVILEAFGMGNAPSDPRYAQAIGEATARGVVVVVCTQCLAGTVNLQTYAGGAALAAAGAVSGFDMTPEAAMTKLYWLLAQGLPPEDVRKLMQVDLRGELTAPDDPERVLI